MDEKESRKVLLLGSTSLINDFASEGIFSALPYYIPSMETLGAISGVIHGLPYILIPFFGMLAERVKKVKNFLLAGYGLSAISKALLALAPKTFLWIFVVLDRAGKAIRTAPRDFLLAKIKEHGKSFGIHRAMDTLGAMLGVLAAYLLLQAGISPRAVILVCGIAALFSLIPILLLDDEEVSAKKKFEFKPEQISLLGIIVGMGSVSPVVLLGVAKEILAVNAILLYLLFNLFHVLSSRYINPLGDKMDKRILLYSAFLTNAVIFFLFYKGLYLIAFPLFGIAYGLLKPLGPSMVADINPRPSAIGFYHFLYGISVLLISYLVGHFYSMVGNEVFLYLSVSSVVLALLSKLFLR